MKKLYGLLFAALFAALTAGLCAQEQPPARQADPKKDKPKVQNSAIEDIRKVFDLNGGQRRVTDEIDPIGVVYARAETPVSFRVNGRIRGHTVVYSLIGAPSDASIEPYTGWFQWTPTQPGTVTFDVAISAKEDPQHFVQRRVTILVSKPLEPYGYEFFAPARAIIQARAEALRTGLTKPSLPVSGERKQPLKSGGVEKPKDGQNGKPQDPPITPSNGQGAKSEPPIDTRQGPEKPDESKQDERFTNPATADALRYLVGPFDMMSSNVYVPSPERYQLGPGDALTIRWWSPVADAQEKTVRVDSQGAIALPMSGRRVVLRGQTLAQAEKLVQRLMADQLRGAEVSIALKELRTMSVTVLGEVFLPGNYQVPSVVTLFNLLYMVGGPNDNGTLRNIELRRNDGTRRKLDMYRFLVFGESGQDVPLQPGDTIFVGPAENRVAVSGEVGRPAIYEVLPTDHLKDVLKYAGGVKATGISQRVTHNTVDPGQGRKLVDIDLDKGTLNPIVFGGDQIQVASIRAVLTNVVTLEGAVDQPGQYQLTEGMTVKTLLEKGRGLLPEAYKARANLIRENEDQTSQLIAIDLTMALAGDPSANYGLRANDRLRVYRVEEAEFLGDRQVTIIGSVKRPGTYPRQDGMRIIDLLLQSGGLLGEAFLDQGFVQRINADGTMGELVKVDFRRAALGDEANNVLIQDRDVVNVQSVSEAKFVPEQQIKILGAVQRPGPYPSSANLSLKDALALAGGPLPNASRTVEIAKSRVPEGTSPTRYSLDDVLNDKVAVTLDPGDLVSVPVDSSIVLAPRTVYIAGAVKNPGFYAINSISDRVSDLVGRAGGFSQEAFPRGAQFYRDPKKLKSLSQERLSPRIQDALAIIAEDEYLRAKAKAEVEAARVAKSVNSAPGIALPTIGGSASTQAASPAIKIEGSTVSPARKLDDSDLAPGGNLDVNVEDAVKKPKGHADVLLEEGDILIVPQTPSHVTVVGAVTVPQSIVFQAGKNVKFYVDRCGGLLSDAGEKAVLIIRANGQVIKAKATTRVELGDLVFVPTKVMAERLTDRQAEIDSITRNVTAVGVMYAIIRSLLGK